MKTVLVVEVEHEKPLPTRQDITDIAAQRIYGWLYSQGVEAGVRVALTAQVKPLLAWEQKEPCKGHDGPGGFICVPDCRRCWEC